MFSLPHGSVGDTVVDGLHPYLEKGDVIIDASNEHVSLEEARYFPCVMRVAISTKP